ncbi:MAG: hypothetical protein CBC57_02050 [Euryarchaeota archaeon TMED97]|nr:MAG: hypothetical protein CBC57_02050 [Euryarchaeota archaeon TMED97]|tara:strand:- start:1550 stop:1753 length:204 start_codon:yes stop_codon:yes gene_type:complete
MSREQITNNREYYFEILDTMQEMGSVNMFGAPAELTKHFDVPRREAVDIVGEWMKSKVVNKEKSITP